MLKDLGVPDHEYVLATLGNDKVISLTNMMLRYVDLPINVTVWKAYYGIDCASVTSERLGERFLPPLTGDQVREIRKETLKLLRHPARFKDLNDAMRALTPKPP